jgi:cytochrome P450
MFLLNSLIASDKTHHMFLRRTIGPSFNTSSLNEFEPILKKYCIQFIDAVEMIAAQKEGLVDIGHWFNSSTFDVLLFTNN